ncbi:MAG: hypothetical protein K9K67_11675 [Bacteriovoracaceae bacterium]|nr:hypothetical protein [Bacteriovoracaceae bacterium]
MGPWLLSFLRPRPSTFLRGRPRRYLFWAAVILIGGPLVLKDEYAQPIVETREKIIKFAKTTASKLTQENEK